MRLNVDKEADALYLRWRDENRSLRRWVAAATKLVTGSEQ